VRQATRRESELGNRWTLVALPAGSHHPTVADIGSNIDEKLSSGVAIDQICHDVPFFGWPMTVAVAQHIYAGSYHQNPADFELDLSGPKTSALLWGWERRSLFHVAVTVTL
jgi:hypothetical protein